MAARAKLRLRYCGDPILRKKAQPLKGIDQRVEKLVEKMFELMEKTEGVGLAAPQVGISERIVVIDTQQDDERLALINPRVVWSSRETCPYPEGCLSVPEVFAEVIRPESVDLEAIGIDGRPIKQRANGLLARVVQHEIDHLDGVLFIDHLSAEARAPFTEQIGQLEQLTPAQRKQAPAL